MKIVILGGPGSGKKTQTSLLSDHYRLTVLTISELVKLAMAEESERGLQLRLLHQAGQAVGDDIVLNLLQQRLSQPDLDNGFILDGFPRNLLQALTLDELLVELGIALDCVLLFEIETDALMERLVGRRTCRSCREVYNVYTHPTVVDDVCDLCGGRLHQRADDTEETVNSRLHVFDHLTGPLLSHYGKQGLVLRVDGEGEVAEVFDRTCRKIDAFLIERANRETAVEPPPLVASLVRAVAEPATEPYQPQPVPASNPAISNPTPAANQVKPDQKEAAGKKSTPKRPPAEKRSTATSSPETAQAKSPATARKSSPAKPRPPRVAAKQAAVKKGPSGQKKAVVKKAAGGKKSKAPAAVGGAKKTKSKPVTKGRVVKKGVTKRSSSKSAAVKKVVNKKAVAKKSTTGKVKVASAAKRPTANKPVKKQIAKKSQVKGKTPVKAKPPAAKKVTKKQTAKPSASRKSAAKQRTSRSGVKKKVAGKPKAAKKTVKKQAVKKRSKASAARR